MGDGGSIGGIMIASGQKQITRCWPTRRAEVASEAGSERAWPPQAPPALPPQAPASSPAALGEAEARREPPTQAAYGESVVSLSLSTCLVAGA